MNNLIEKQAYSIDEFCLTYRISNATFYKMAREGKAPPVRKIGRRSVIDIDDAKKWWEGRK